MKEKANDFIVFIYELARFLFNSNLKVLCFVKTVLKLGENEKMILEQTKVMEQISVYVIGNLRPVNLSLVMICISKDRCLG